MADGSSSQNELKKAKTNTPPDSVVEAHVAPAPLLFLRPETGEIIGVPKSDSHELIQHYTRLADVMAEYQSAVRAVQACDEMNKDIGDRLGANQVVSQQERQQVDKVSQWAWEWHNEAHDAVQAELKPLGKLDGGGKKLIELIELKEKSAEEQEKDKQKSREPKLEGATLKKKLMEFQNAAQLKKGLKWPKTPFEKLLYVRSDKLKPSWPKFKDKDKTKWSEVYAKNAQGVKRFDAGKMKSYTHEQVKAIKLSSADFIKLEGDYSGTPSEFAQGWNQEHQWKNDGDLKYGDTKLMDMDLSAQAQLLRYTMGGSLKADFSPFDPKWEFSAQGSAEFALAEGKADATFYLPGKEGYLWQIYDMNSQPHDMVAMRVKSSTSLTGVAGASISGQLGMSVEVPDLEKPKIGGKPGRKPKRRPKTVAVNRDDDTNLGALDAELEVFAGLRADLEITGGIEWRDPEDKKKDFAEIASISPKVGGMAGVAANAKFKVEFINGIFRCTAHAGLCLGLGAEGAISFAVSAKQLVIFQKCLYYHFMIYNFKNLEIVTDVAFNAIRDLAYLAVTTGKGVEEFFGQTVDSLGILVIRIEKSFEDAKERKALAVKILNNPPALKYSIPETKGMLIYQLMLHGYADYYMSGGSLGASYLKEQRLAILNILKWAQTKRDVDNIIQHIGPSGEKDWIVTHRHKSSLSELVAFFSTEGPRDIDIPFVESPYEGEFKDFYNSLPSDEVALSGNFNEWFQGLQGYLRDEPPHGYAVAQAGSTEYDLTRGEEAHSMYASNGNNAFYGSLA